MRAKFYVVLNRHSKNLQVFRALFECPSVQKYGHLFSGIWGPYKTKRAAIFVSRWYNPNHISVMEAEKLAKTYANNISSSK